MADPFDEKTLAPTPHRRQRARDEGQVARSADFASAGLLLGGLAALVFTGGALVDYLAGYLTASLGGRTWMHWINSGTPADAQAIAGQWNPLALELGRVLLPPLLLLALLGVALHVVQTGVLFLPHKLLPDPARINPLAGWRRVFSGGSVIRLSLGAMKLAIIAAVAFASVYDRRTELVSIGVYELPQVVAFLWDLCLWTGLKVGSALLILAVIDYGYERWRHERELRMTPQELREEMRNMQGDPQVASRRRNDHRQLVTGELPRL
jgi:flagellar biosynthetic protein FlhB